VVRAHRRNARRKTPLVPNGKTLAAMREARVGKLPRFKGAAALLRELNKGD
jgi:hypothetical protein